MYAVRMSAATRVPLTTLGEFLDSTEDGSLPVAGVLMEIWCDRCGERLGVQRVWRASAPGVIDIDFTGRSGLSKWDGNAAWTERPQAGVFHEAPIDYVPYYRRRCRCQPD